MSSLSRASQKPYRGLALSSEAASHDKSHTSHTPNRRNSQNARNSVNPYAIPAGNTMIYPSNGRKFIKKIVLEANKRRNEELKSTASTTFENPCFISASVEDKENVKNTSNRSSFAKNPEISLKIKGSQSMSMIETTLTH
jgi:hypothetical protein